MLKTTLKLSFFYLKLLKYKLYIVLKLLLLKTLILFETLHCLKLKGRRHLTLFKI